MRKREKSRKHRIITIVIALAVILALLLSAVSCSGCGKTSDTQP